MNPEVDPLAQLRDIHLPPTPEFVIAPGWWLLALALLAAVAVVGWLIWQRWQRSRYRREAMQALKTLHASYAEDGDASRFVTELQLLLKRVALTGYPRARVAALIGESWVAFLDESYGGQEFRMGAGQALIDGAYRIDVPVDVEALAELAGTWIRTHDRRREITA